MENHGTLPQGQVRPLAERALGADVVDVVRLQLGPLPGLDGLIVTVRPDANEDESTHGAQRPLHDLGNGAVVEDRRGIDTRDRGAEAQKHQIVNQVLVLSHS